MDKKDAVPLMHATLASFCLVLAIAPAIAEEPPASKEALERFDAYIRGVEASGDFSGVVLVARHGEVVFERAYGARDEKLGDPLKVDTRFDLASAGKMFTITATLQQIAAGKMSLETTLGEVMPDYSNPAMRQATVRQLLTHTAGAGEADALFYPDSLTWQGREPALADFVALYDDRSPTYTPGSDQAYGNHGMILLGRMVEVLSGQDYRTYVEQHIYLPAGMDAAHANEACSFDNPAQAVAYITVGDERIPNCFSVLDSGWPAGGQSFNARDMLRFVNSLREGRLGVPRALFEQAITPQVNGFGLGFFATGYGGEFLSRDLRWGHGGKLYGQCVDIRSYETTNETVITLGNNDSPACFRVADFLHVDWKARRSDEKTAFSK
ncbi:beta-lactamase family protein [Altererythrobacter sp. BO-6]|uniref:serine hydrolase domain-containing protein n=1 Tax=Altererythrobacter sp. BO-6 TaxID=2604537 RepID=UPI0013E1A6E3|nr:serine hydrolase domain-containing protein [Altererythrobacter sp. BO-6]QIG54100.1 beta-lactamase family protein [Altererythrobacter sp. BO-6]